MLRMLKARGSIFLAAEYIGRWERYGWNRADIELALNDLAAADQITLAPLELVS